ncbi:forkhead-associated (FHA) domain protein [Vibrio phage 150E35-1]|nr:forkhead-associated (FHA) domain protein [Vibrio phage 150E35-1]
MKTRKLFVCNGTGNGKSTLLDRIKGIGYGDVVLHHDVSATALKGDAKAQAEFNLRQTRLIGHIWAAQTGGKKDDATLHVYDRSVLDYMDASLRSNNIKAYNAAMSRWTNSVLRPTPEFWDGCTFVVAPTPTLALMQENWEYYLVGKRGEYWSGVLGVDFVSIPNEVAHRTELLSRIHEQMVRSEAWITSQLKYLEHSCRAQGSNITVINFNEVSRCVYDRFDGFYRWQDIAIATMDATLRGLSGHATYTA